MLENVTLASLQNSLCEIPLLGTQQPDVSLQDPPELPGSQSAGRAPQENKVVTILIWKHSGQIFRFELDL